MVSWGPPRLNPRVVVIGAGFGGLSVARGLRRTNLDVVLVDQHNYHLFTPLLYEVGTALLDSSEIAYPVRGIFHRVPNVDFKIGRVVGIDVKARRVRTDEGELGYDYLVVAAGSVSNFFGNTSAERNAYALKDMGEAWRCAIRSWPASRRRPGPRTAIGGGGFSASWWSVAGPLGSSLPAPSPS